MNDQHTARCNERRIAHYDEVAAFETSFPNWHHQCHGTGVVVATVVISTGEPAIYESKPCLCRVSGLCPLCQQPVDGGCPGCPVGRVQHPGPFICSCYSEFVLHGVRPRTPRKYYDEYGE